MTEPRAHYFHSTVYSFNAKAVEAVIRNLHDAVKSVAVQCHYDRNLDVSMRRWAGLGWP